jgi:pSer/pThr/pTyr-binding forkhead associated (FHA) protein
VHGTFVNGKKIPPDTKYKLLDGDIVSLGMSHDPKDTKINVRSRNYYVFKIKVYNL